jgi:hypothetical protein
MKMSAVPSSLSSSTLHRLARLLLHQPDKHYPSNMQYAHIACNNAPGLLNGISAERR